ncbi:MAG: YcaO-like family protein [Pseudomonadota bacterium]
MANVTACPPDWTRSSATSARESHRIVTIDEVEALRHRLEAGPTQALTTRDSNAERDWKAIRLQLGRFGITRVGDITGLDRIGVPVVQAVRPAAKSNIVNQGKGLTMAQAALSAVMEGLETWAAERLPRQAQRRATAAELIEPAVSEALKTIVLSDSIDGWQHRPFDWVPGWDLVNRRVTWMPAAIVATDYTLSSPYRSAPFLRTTTGLGAGLSAWAAVQQGVAEIVERDATAKALEIHGFFDRYRLDTASIKRQSLVDLVAKVRAAGLLIGFWTCPAPDSWAVVWARALEAADQPDQLPLPADGYGASPNIEVAAEKALLEAVQTRASVIAGSREDITRTAYPRFPNRHLIEADRRMILADAGAPFEPEGSNEPCLDLGVLGDGSKRPVIVVPLLAETDPGIFVVRVVLPGMRVAAE